jgi:hypothetical protein
MRGFTNTNANVRFAQLVDAGVDNQAPAHRRPIGNVLRRTI